MEKNNIQIYISKVKKAQNEIDSILEKNDYSIRPKIITLKSLLKSISGLPIDIQDYFNESIKCLEMDLNRASMIMAWAGFFHVFSQRMCLENEDEIRKKRDKWKFSNHQELKENFSESAIIDVSKEIQFINKSDLRIYQGYLSQRNKCAHPTLYVPTKNYAIGYVNELIELTNKYL